jgi:hypothetical protein
MGTTRTTNGRTTVDRKKAVEVLKEVLEASKDSVSVAGYQLRCPNGSARLKEEFQLVIYAFFPVDCLDRLQRIIQKNGLEMILTQDCLTIKEKSKQLPPS